MQPALNRPRGAEPMQQIPLSRGQGGERRATAEGIQSVAKAIEADGGLEAVQLRVAEQYIGQFGNLAKASTSLVIPSNLADVASMLATAMNVIQAKGRPPVPPAR